MKTTPVLLAMTTGLAAPLAQAGTGDLDPSFADHGRLGPIPDAAGEARTVELLDSGGILVGGGKVRIWYNGSRSPRCSIQNFASKLSEAGTVDPAFSGEYVDSVEPYGLASQPDGRIVAAGRKVSGNPLPTGWCNFSSSLAVYRFESDGSLDPGFGTNGVFKWINGGRSEARSLVLEPDGRIVVAGFGTIAVGEGTESALVVLRLLANGELDSTFGTGGVLVGPVVRYSSQVRVARNRAGAYRVSAAAASDGCAIVGITANGVLDATFGEAGIAPVISAGGMPVHCEALEFLSNDQVLVGGSDSKGVSVSRLLSSGAPDASFVADAAIADFVSQVTAIAASRDGHVLVAGTGQNGASITRLLSSGELDMHFGDDGKTWIDLRSDYRSTPLVRDMAIREDGGVIAAGYDPAVGPFVVRLIGNDGGASPGVVGFLEFENDLFESDGGATLRVRRRGGSDGSTSVRYRTREGAGVTSDLDFKAVAGTLHWADGDTSEREIAVEVNQDNGPAEGFESFHVALDGTQGGAGIGAGLATINIQPDGSPGGQVYFYGAPSITEEGGTGQFLLAREYFFSGRICVTLTPRSRTARAGEDFDGGETSVCWDDQDAAEKLVEIEIIDDSADEGQEMFTVELSNPTGGALIAGPGSVDVPIAASDRATTPPPPPPPGNDNHSGGGGSTGLLELVLVFGGLMLNAGRRSRFATATMKAILSLLIVASGLITPLAQAATGDLDRSFGSHGRLAPIGAAGGAAIFVETLGTGGIVVGGGDVDASGRWWSEPGMPCTYRVSGSSFVGLLGDDGTVDPAFSTSAAPGIAARAVARQPDGKIVLLGREIKLISTFRCSHSSNPVVLRLGSDGSFDPTFGSNGILHLHRLTAAASLALDSRGRIVIAGLRWVDGGDSATPGRYELTVLRLRADGTLDGSFGAKGSYFGPVADADALSPLHQMDHRSSAMNLTPSGSGGYRVSLASEGDCKIVGVTANGEPDTAFGSEGIVTLRGAGGARVNCLALESAPGGSLLVAGSARKHGFVARLLESGVPDSAFTADAAISTSMNRVTSVAIAPDGKLLVAGTEPKGASILRLLATGERDTAFGDAGRTWIDLDSTDAPQPIVRDMAVREDGSVIVVGGDVNSDRSFVVRLLGDGGGTSRGVLGFSRWHAAPLESGGKAILRVRRSGGSYGAVSARYRTVANLDARAHEDFVPESGRLQWDAGDTSEKTILIRIVQSPEPEILESFRVELDRVRGGAGLGTRGATVDIQPDGSPGGQIEIDPQQLEASESGYDQIILRRSYYFEGRVCVTLTAMSGTATAGRDFSADPSVVCWNDQEEDWKLPTNGIVDDNQKEGIENFRIVLSNPTGGAIIGPSGSATITLHDND